jgi:hypothetical protein
MVTNYPGPGELRFYYSVGAGVRTHSQRMSVRYDGAPSPGDDSSTIDLLRRNDTVVDLEAFVDAYAAIWASFYPGGASMDYVEFWTYPPLSTDGTYITTYAVGVVGTNVAASNIGFQDTFTFRTQEGGVFKIVMLENIYTDQQPHSLSVPAAGGEADLVDLVIDPLFAVFLAKDTSYPVAGLRRSGGQNERLFRKIFRDT